MTTSTGGGRLDPDAGRLLLLVARDVLDDVQQSEARQLARKVDDWNRFIEVSTRSFGVCMAYCSLARLGDDSVPTQALDRMRNTARIWAARSLMIESTLLGFMSSCLAPSGVRHAFFKGPALARRYYATPASRPCRDIDVLIDHECALEVVSRAKALGYVPDDEIGPSERDLAAWVRYATVYPMRAPNGVLVEIHRSLDHGEGVLDVNQMLSRTERMLFCGRELAVLSTPDLFVYVCMHHTRHFWSHLHWYGDLDAITRHPEFDPVEVRRIATHTGLLSTVQACLRLNDIARTADWPQLDAPGQGTSTQLLARSLECLEGGQAREEELRASRLSSDRAFAWQLSDDRLVNRLRMRLRSFLPSFSDYRAWPLPRWLQPVYYLSRPLRIALSRLNRGRSMLRGKASDDIRQQV